MTTTAEPSDPSSSPESQDSAAPQRLGQRMLALLRRFRPQRSDRDAIETILEQPQNHETELTCTAHTVSYTHLRAHET